MVSTLVAAEERNIRRILVTGRVGGVLGVLGHGTQAVGFYALDRPSLMFANIVSTCLFAAAFALLSAGRAPRLCWWAILIELNITNLFTTVELGLGSGYIVYPLVAGAITSSISFDTARRRFLAVAATFLASILVVLWVIQTGPRAPMSPEMTTGFLVGNTVFMGAAAAVILWYYAAEITRAEASLESEYRRSEGLLLNMLPASIAARLKSGEALIADNCSQATVVFADIVGFTPIVAGMQAPELVGLLRDLVSRFDAAAERLGVEKIKTIGDAYMAVVGAPDADDRHAEKAARLALEMIKAAREVKGPSGAPINIRVGLHSGPVIAGVIGERRMAFDLWGDTVNTAARMETTSLPGRVQVSEATKEHLGSVFGLEPRGSIDIKGKGTMATWLLGDALAPEGGTA